MNECTDRDQGRKLEAYEFGMLGDAEREAFERHLIECEHCSKKALELGEAVHLLREDPDVRNEIQEIADNGAFKESAVKKSRRPRWLTVAGSTAAVAIAVVLLVLQPWRIEIRTDDPAIAAVDRLAVTYFDNVADSSDVDRLGEIAANLLITDLSESRHLSVVSGQRVFDILKSLGREGEKRIDRRTAAEVAREARASWLLVGSILQVRPTLVVTSQLIDVKTGEVKSSQQIRGENSEDVFSVVDRLSKAIREDLSLPVAAGDEVDRPVAEVTTHSPEAYRAFIEGVDLLDKFYKQDAVEKFEKALEYDSTFAMAYYYLSTLVDRNLIEKAVQYVDRVGRREQFFIRSRYALIQGDIEGATEELMKVIEQFPDEKQAYYWIGVYEYQERNYDAAIKRFNEAITIDPLYKSAINYLAYAYDKTEQFDKAIAAINEYISLVPDEANPYDSRGDLYASMNLLDKAIESYCDAIEIKPDFYDSWSKLCGIHLYRKEFAEAEECVQKMKTSTNNRWRASGRLYSALALLGQNQLMAALDELKSGIVADSVESPDGWLYPAASKRFTRSIIYEVLGDGELAVAEIEEVIRLIGIANPSDRESYRCRYVGLLASVSSFEKADEVIAELCESSDPEASPSVNCDYASGVTAFYRGDPDFAIARLEAITSASEDFAVGYMLARIYIAAEKYEKAAQKLEKMQAAYRSWGPCYTLYSDLIPYYLGLAYEGKGSVELAVSNYSELLDNWKDADVELEMVKDAKRRLARLSVVP